jgi:hypothetical protein
LAQYRRPAFVAALLVLFFGPCLFARGQVWNFLGFTKLDGNRDHGRIEIKHNDRLFRTIQLRVSGDAVFFDRFVAHFGNATSQELVLGSRILKVGKEYVVEFPGDGRELESVEFWYYKEPWKEIPSVSLYGSSSAGAASASIAEER